MSSPSPSPSSPSSLFDLLLRWWREGRLAVLGTIHTPSFLVYTFAIVIVQLLQYVVGVYIVADVLTCCHDQRTCSHVSSGNDFQPLCRTDIHMKCVCVYVHVCSTTIGQVHTIYVTSVDRRHTPCSTSIVVKELLNYICTHNLGLPTFCLHFWNIL